MKRSIRSYADCTPEAVAGGSPAQMQFFVKDAKADIAALVSALKGVEDSMDSIDGSVTKTAIMRIIAEVLE